MVKVIAKHVGYYNGKVREIGEEFELVNAQWVDEKIRPSWVDLADGEEEPPAQAEMEKRPVKRNKGKAEPDAGSALPDEGGAQEGQADSGGG